MQEPRFVHDVSQRSVQGPLRIALTGGQTSGKTTVSNRVASEMGDSVLCVPEAVTVFRQKIMPRPPLSDLNAVRAFQAELFTFQVEYEHEAWLRAKRLQRHAVLFNRGTLDGAAYLEGGLEAFERLNGTTVHEQFERYHVVIFLCQAPRNVFEEERPTSSGWPCAHARHETLEGIWPLHPCACHVEVQDLEAKVQQSISIIRRVLNEVEAESA